MQPVLKKYQGLHPFEAKKLIKAMVMLNVITVPITRLIVINIAMLTELFCDCPPTAL